MRQIALTVVIVLAVLWAGSELIRYVDKHIIHFPVCNDGRCGNG